MADIELVIKIPEETYKDIQSHDWKNTGRWFIEEWKAIANGTPHETVTEFADRCRECGREKVLDKIKAEITNIPITDTDGHNNNWYREPQWIINDVLQIIDKYKGESEGEG